MPSPKRYFHCSQDINDDEELWEMTDEIGDRSIRVWLEILAQLDKRGNTLPITGGWVKKVSRKVRQASATVWRVVRHALAKGWLTILEGTEKDLSFVVTASNFLKYHRKQVRTGSEWVANKEHNETPLTHPPSLPFPSPPSFSSNEEKEKEKGEPPFFYISPAVREEMSKIGVVDIDAECSAWTDHCLANGLVFQDQVAAFRGWCRKAVKLHQPTKTKPSYMETLKTETQKTFERLRDD